MVHCVLAEFLSPSTNVAYLWARKRQDSKLSVAAVAGLRGCFNRLRHLLHVAPAASANWQSTSDCKSLVSSVHIGKSK